MIMQMNFFKEPSGIFTLKKGFSMGCKSSAIATDILLLASEFRMFSSFQKQKILHIVKRYFRFRDDVNSRLTGNIKEMCLVLKLIATRYPKSMDFNINISFLHNTFLNIRTYVIPEETNLSISVLRKVHDKHDIVRAESYTHPNYVGAALRTSAHTTKTITNHQFHKAHQINVYNEILEAKGYSREQFSRMFYLMNKPKRKFTMEKSYGGKITYDGLTKIDDSIRELLSSSNLPETISMPISVGNKKTKNYVFTKRRFYETLKSEYEKIDGKI